MSDLRVNNLKARTDGNVPTIVGGAVISGITTISGVLEAESGFTAENVSATGIATISTAIVGTAVTGGNNGLTFPANTYVSNIYTVSWGGNTFYEVQFNNSFTGTLALGSGTIEATFEQPPHAQPGETVFSFIAVPGERSTLDLKDLKELTNTTLGGRGTFPNGPDVLAINVFKTAGTDVNANIILRWSEAQA